MIPQHVAMKVLEECGIKHPCELSLQEIIFGRGAYYNEKPLIGMEGKIFSYNNSSIITVNSEIEFESKKRFVAAHELGHHEMHRDLIPVFKDTEKELLSWFKGGQHEIDANEFASELLMPIDLFKNFCKGKKFNPNLIDQLAEYFLASKTATILRFIKAGNHPICVIYIINNKMKWWKKSDDFGYFLNFSSNIHPPQGSVAYEMFTTDNRYSKENAQQEIWKSTWFNLNRDEKDSILYEYCMYVPSFNYALSVVYED